MARGTCALALLVACTPQAAVPSYGVGGTVEGLFGEVVVDLHGDEVRVREDGTFAFPSLVPDGASYEVTIAAQPSTQECSLTHATGVIAGADVADVRVTCTDTHAWSERQTVSFDIGAYMPSAIDAVLEPDGDATVVWFMPTESPGNLFVADRRDGEWTFPESLDQGVGLSAAFTSIGSQTHRLLRLPDGTDYIVYASKGPVLSTVLRVIRRPAGGSWETPELWPIDSDYEELVSFDADVASDGTAVVGWQAYGWNGDADNHCFARVYSGGAWSAIERPGDLGLYTRPQVLAMEGGAALLFAVEGSGLGPLVVFRYQDGAWQPHETVSEEQVLRISAVGRGPGGRVFVAFRTRQDGIDDFHVVMSDGDGWTDTHVMAQGDYPTAAFAPPATATVLSFGTRLYSTDWTDDGWDDSPPFTSDFIVPDAVADGHGQVLVTDANADVPDAVYERGGRAWRVLEAPSHEGSSGGSFAWATGEGVALIVRPYLMGEGVYWTFLTRERLED